MKAYVVALNESRMWYDYYQEEAPELVFPIGVYAAETPGQAKSDAFKDFQKGTDSVVYSDDWNNLRVLLLHGDVQRERGPYDSEDPIWELIPREWPTGWNDDPTG